MLYNSLFMHLSTLNDVTAIPNTTLNDSVNGSALD